jgi:hypothetical protein
MLKRKSHVRDSSSQISSDISASSRGAGAAVFASAFRVAPLAPRENRAPTDAEVVALPNRRSRARSLRERFARGRTHNPTVELGAMLVGAGVIDAQQLKRAMVFKEAHPKLSLADCLVELQILKRGTVDLFVLQQQALRSGKPGDLIKFAQALEEKSRGK